MKDNVVVFIYVKFIPIIISLGADPQHARDYIIIILSCLPLLYLWLCYTDVLAFLPNKIKALSIS